MRIFKRAMALLLMLVMVVSMVPVGVFAAEPQTQVDTGDVTIEGTNGFGNLLSDAITEEQESDAEGESEYEAGYTVTDLVIEGDTATVTYDSLEEAILIVALYTEDGMQMVTSAKTTVTPDATEATVTFGDDMPEYFLASAYLVDTYDLSPLCPAYDTPMYTREMQELLASTVDDYDPEKVLNLDDDETTNFAVYAETTKVIAYAEGINTVFSVDEETSTYIIKNADEQFTTLQEGDVFAYIYGPNELLIAKVDSISVDDTTVTITGDSVEMEDVFSHVKLDAADDGENIEVDESAADEGVTYIGTEMPNYSPQDANSGGSVTASKSHVFKVEYPPKADKEDEDDDPFEAEFKFSGTLKAQIKTSFSYYLSLSKCYVQFKIESGFYFNVTVTGSISDVWLKLPVLGISPVPGVYIEFAPKLIFEAEASITLDINLTSTLGFYRDTTGVYRSLNTEPKVETNLEVSGSVFFGIDMNPSVLVLGGTLLEIRMTAKAGATVSGELCARAVSPELEIQNSAPKVHDCLACLEGKVVFSLNCSVKIEFLKCKWLSATINLLDLKSKPQDFYWSFDTGNHDWGKCPNIAYRVTITVRDENYSIVEGATVACEEETLGTTNKRGILVRYLRPDVYDVKVYYDDGSVKDRFKVSEACSVVLSPVTVNVPAANRISPDAITDHTVYASGTCGSFGYDVEWFLYASGQMVISGDGPMVSFLTDTAAPWHNFRDKITSVHVKSGVTSVSRNAFTGCENLTKVVLADTVEQIDESAFKNCTALDQVRMPVDVKQYIYYSKSSQRCFGPFDGCTNVTQIHYTYGRTGCMRNNGASASYDGYYGNTLAYQSRESLQTVYLDNSITTIGDYAFTNAANLTVVSIPSSLTSIGQYAFCNNTSLFDAQLPDSVTSIGRYAFQNCQSLPSVNLTNNLTSLGDRAFENCASLSQVTISSALTYIPDTCFKGCTGLTELVIPDSITYIQYYAFQNCTGLTKVTIPVDVKQYASSNFGVFSGCTNIREIHFTYGQTGVMASLGNNPSLALTQQCRNALETVTFADGITNIPNYAFQYAVNLKNVVLPDSLTTIGDRAFEDNTSLTSIHLPASLTSIGSYAFQQCTALSELILPAGLEKLGTYAFELCVSLTSVVIPSGMTSIPSSCFKSCSGLKTLVIPDSITSIETYAFMNCANLETVTMPVDAKQKSYSNVGCFTGCSNVTTIHYTAGQTGIMAVSGEGYQNGLTYHSRNFLQTVTMEEGITSISSDAFNGASQLVRVELPSTLQTIGSSAFRNNTSLKYITLPDSLKSIGSYAFLNCRNLTDINLCKGIETLGNNAFEGCTGLTEVVIPSTMTHIPSNCFKSCSGLKTLVIPDSITSIETYAFMNCANLETVTMPVDAKQKSYNEVGCFTGCSNVTTIHYTAGQTGIMSTPGEGYENGLNYHSRKSLQTVTLAEGITSIARDGFRGTTSLTEIRFPSTVETIGIQAFAGSGLERISFSGNAPSFGSNCFQNVTAQVRYPAGNSSWTENVMQNYGGTLTWSASAGTAASEADEEETVREGVQTSETIVAQPASSPMPVYDPKKSDGEAEVTRTYGGEYGTEITEGRVLKTASFSGLVPGEQYLLLAMKSIEVEDPLAADNLLFVDQAAAGEDGTLVFTYVQRETTDISYVVACGASNKNLNDAEITFPEMTADGELQVVNPTVVYDGEILTEGLDYTIVGSVSFTKGGTYTCYIRGIHNYTGLVECTYTVEEDVTEVANGWSGYTTWVLTNDGVLTFSGEGNMKNYTYKSEMPWYGYFDQITSVVIEEGVTSIGDYAFYGMDITSIEIPETVTTIGEYAFKNAPKINNVVLPGGLTKLGESAFYACTGLTSIEIPASLWTIQPYTFKNCANLTSVKFNEGNLQKISDGAFYGTGLTELVLPDCLDILDVYAFKGCDKLASITIGNGLTELREAVFYGTAISEITIPEGITKIGPYAFKNCVKLETIDLPESLTSVGEASFYADTALKAVELPDAVTTIGNYAFRKCEALETLTFGSELVTIGECSFYGCTGLTDLVIPDKVTTIKPYAFKTCTGLTSVTLGKKVATIGEGAFNTCTGLKTIVFPESLATIGDYCFSGSYNLWKLTFQGDAPTIGTGAFKGMAATAYYPSGNATWTSAVMQNYGGTVTWRTN